MVTLAAGTTALAGSVTVPVMVPRSLCAKLAQAMIRSRIVVEKSFMAERPPKMRKHYWHVIVCNLEAERTPSKVGDCQEFTWFEPDGANSRGKSALAKLRRRRAS